MSKIYAVTDLPEYAPDNATVLAVIEDDQLQYLSHSTDREWLVRYAQAIVTEEFQYHTALLPAGSCYRVEPAVEEPRKRLGYPKRCAVCGDTCHVNVRLCWRRDRDQKLFDICLLCAERGRVNEHTVDTYGPSPFQDVEANNRWHESFWDTDGEDE